MENGYNNDNVSTPLVNTHPSDTRLCIGRSGHDDHNMDSTVIDTNGELTSESTLRSPADSFEPILNSWVDCYHNARTWLKKQFFNVLLVLSVGGYITYLVFVILYDFEHEAFIAILDATFVLLWMINKFVKLRDIAGYITRPVRVRFSARKKTCTSCHPHLRRRFRTIKKYFRSVVTVLLIIAIIVLIIIDARNRPHILIPIGGIALFIIVLWASSTHPFKVSWVPVVWGVLLQFVFGLIILRWEPGFMAVKEIGSFTARFLRFADNGSEIVFGSKYTDHPVAFQILPTVVFFSSFVSILYYWGIMQMVISGIAKVFQYVMQTTSIESFATASQIFIGAIETSAIIKPFVKDLTCSELNAVLTGGFATVAGTVIAAYIEFGVPPEHVIAASFMSAPAALAVAKLTWPEKNKKIDRKIDIKISDRQDYNLMEAAFLGAAMAIKLVAYVIVTLIAFPALLAFLDYVLSFMGSRVGHPEFNFEFICSYLFMPIAVITGVPWKDCNLVGKLIGKKIFINEFLAYSDLGIMIKTRQLEEISVVISTYLLCGFGSVAAMGINFGAYVAAENSRREDYAKVMLRAMVGGNIACFMTACIAGVLLPENAFMYPHNANATANYTLLGSTLDTATNTTNRTLS